MDRADAYIATTGSIAPDAVQETEREERKLLPLPARKIPKDVVIQVPAQQPAYEPAAAAPATDQASANAKKGTETATAQFTH